MAVLGYNLFAKKYIHSRSRLYIACCRETSIHVVKLEWIYFSESMLCFWYVTILTIRLGVGVLHGRRFLMLLGGWLFLCNCLDWISRLFVFTTELYKLFSTLMNKLSSFGGFG